MKKSIVISGPQASGKNELIKAFTDNIDPMDFVVIDFIKGITYPIALIKMKKLVIIDCVPGESIEEVWSFLCELFLVAATLVFVTQDDVTLPADKYLVFTPKLLK